MRPGYMCVDGFPSDDMILYCLMGPLNINLITYHLGCRQGLALSLISGCAA